jgi:hypothetical protein
MPYNASILTMGAITTKIFELLEAGTNIETQRATGILINSNYFDALDCLDGVALPGGGEDKKDNCETDKK